VGDGRKVWNTPREKKKVCPDRRAEKPAKGGGDGGKGGVRKKKKSSKGVLHGEEIFSRKNRKGGVNLKTKRIGRTRKFSEENGEDGNRGKSTSNPRKVKPPFKRRLSQPRCRGRK